MMDLESDEAEIILDENSHPIDIIKRERGESERLIEQFMLCANKAVARFCLDRKLPCVYRVHEAPDMEKIRAFSLFARNIGVDVSFIGKDETTPLELSRVLDSAKRLEKADVISSVLLRSLMKAKYSSVPKIHFGLATDCYCHFTSPIRRYPDLSVHRIIKSYLNGSYGEKAKALSKFADRSAKESSENELRALYAEREIEELYKAVYMKDRLGKEYDATVSSITSFGFFAKTDKLCEGLVPIGTLNGHFYFDESNLTLSSGKKSFRLGDRIRIRVADADIVSRRVTFALSDEDFSRDIAVKESISFSSVKRKPAPKNSTRKGQTKKRFSGRSKGNRRR
jgi:ribonuclease R